jgi:hypothetical protein
MSLLKEREPSIEELKVQLKEANEAISILIKAILPFADAVTCKNAIYTYQLNFLNTEDYKQAYVAYKTVIKQSKLKLKMEI